MRRFSQIALYLVLVTALGGYGAAQAHGDETHRAPATAESDEQPQIPATAAEVWTRIDAEVAELDKLVAGSQLSQLHHHAYAVRDLAAALPERSKTLPADKLANLKSKVKFVATLAKRLDAAGDDNNKTAAQSGVEQLKKVLAGMR